MDNQRRILVTGGCGYVGSVLVPKLARKYPVVVLDTLWFGNPLKGIKNVTCVHGDIRDRGLMYSLLDGVTDVIHLASIANDPSAELDPALTWAVNQGATENLVRAARERGGRRFIYASTSSVYGVKEEEKVTEDLPLTPVTVYAKSKAESEKSVLGAASPDFTTVALRSATVCGVSPRMRFDVIVNIMARLAVTQRLITVHGGGQYRPNVHIEDITDLYVALLEAPAEKLNGKVYNFGGPNHTVLEIAQMAQEEIGGEIKIDPNAIDPRSYRITSELIKKELGLEPKRTIRQAIRDIKKAFDQGMFPNPDDPMYYNIRTMKAVLSTV